MQKDRFWRIFWSAGGIVVLVYAIGIVWLRFSYLHAPDDATLAAAVDVSYDPSRDPFSRATGEQNSVQNALASGYLYRDSLPLGFEDWSWGIGANWRSNLKTFEDSFALQAQFLEPWGGIRLNASGGIDISEYRSVSLSVHPDGPLTDLYIDLYDNYGNSMGRQSLAWYAPEGKLVPNTWNTLAIPLANLVAPTNTKIITGFSISVGTETGAAFIDAVHLEKELIAHSRWEEPVAAQGWEDLFVSTVPVSLPYSLSLSDEGVDMWRPLFGKFEKGKDGVLIGPLEKKTNGSMAVFSGGKNWKDYRADATVYWGMTSTFSLLVRFSDDANFVSCAYSNYGAVIQIYQVKNGESTLIGQSPLLAIRAYEPWINAKHAAEVRGDRVSCFMDGEKIISATLPDMSKEGTVGLETWSINSDDYPHVLKELTVTSL